MVSPFADDSIKRCGLFCCLLIAFGSSALGDRPRTQVKGTPELFGREIERLVLVRPIVLDRSQPGVPFASTLMVRVPAGIFIPVAQDEDGIFYQAVKGYRTIRGNGVVGGGLYLSKKKSGAVWVYVGDARIGSKEGVEKDRLPLPAEPLRSLLTGKAEGKKKTGSVMLRRRVAPVR